MLYNADYGNSLHNDHSAFSHSSSIFDSDFFGTQCAGIWLHTKHREIKMVVPIYMGLKTQIISGKAMQYDLNDYADESPGLNVEKVSPI
jgi:hypothetical protein